jgi:hypothetical protein
MVAPRFLPRFVKRLRDTSKRARRAAVVERPRGAIEYVAAAAGLDVDELG